MLKHVRSNSTVGKLFMIDVDWLQKWPGIGVCVMANPGAKKYLMAIREFPSDTGIYCHEEETKGPS